MSDDKLRSVRNDVRFSETNITRWCYTSYVDFHRCKRLLGDGYENCKLFERAYLTICPNAWIEKFNEQIKNGTFPVDLPKKCG